MSVTVSVGGAEQARLSYTRSCEGTTAERRPGDGFDESRGGRSWSAAWPDRPPHVLDSMPRQTSNIKRQTKARITQSGVSAFEGKVLKTSLILCKDQGGRPRRDRPQRRRGVLPSSESQVITSRFRSKPPGTGAPGRARRGGGGSDQVPRGGSLGPYLGTSSVDINDKALEGERGKIRLSDFLTWRCSSRRHL